MKPVFLFECEETDVIVVMTVQHWDLRSYSAGWMCSEDLKEGSTFVPDVDIMDEEFRFPRTGEGMQAALRKVAELYAEQLREESPEEG